MFTRDEAPLGSIRIGPSRVRVPEAANLDTVLFVIPQGNVVGIRSTVGLEAVSWNSTFRLSVELLKSHKTLSKGRG